MRWSEISAYMCKCKKKKEECHVPVAVKSSSGVISVNDVVSFGTWTPQIRTEVGMKVEGRLKRKHSAVFALTILKVRNMMNVECNVD